MNDLILIISGIISLIILIVFFVMANNLSKVLSEIRNIRDLMTLQAKIKGINDITCSNCKENFYTDATEEINCPKCNTLIKINDQK